jgi:hypothetical protein
MGVGISMQIFNPKSQIQRRKTKIMDRIELKAFVAEENNLHIHVQKTQVFV